MTLCRSTLDINMSNEFYKNKPSSVRIRLKFNFIYFYTKFDQWGAFVAFNFATLFFYSFPIQFVNVAANIYDIGCEIRFYDTFIFDSFLLRIYFRSDCDSKVITQLSIDILVRCLPLIVKKTIIISKIRFKNNTTTWPPNKKYIYN